MTTTLSSGVLTITYTATQAKLQRILLSAAEGLYPAYPVYVGGVLTPFADLTNAQKLNIIDQHVKRVLSDASKSQIVNAAMDAARITAGGEDVEIP